MWVFPLAAAAISLAFSVSVLLRWGRSRGPHLLAWGTALGLFAVASGAAAAGMLAGWTTAWFRTYYFCGAILNVPVLAVGTIYVLGGRSLGHLAAAVVTAAAIFALVQTVQGDLATDALASSTIPSGRAVAPATLRTLSRVYSFVGFFIVLGGAVWSAVRLWRAGGVGTRALAEANALIAAGTFIVFIASVFARVGRGAPFAVGLALGVAVMYAGFLRTRPRSPA